ncbi:MAG: hypothetical protein KC800_05015, partial [Candidatus Eremiobacteraeota bacterium]|nr:hypothetical protein [Candidatus Eremiobacteraeota bacterium]
LLSDVSSFLEAPNSGSLLAPNGESANIVARNLLSLKAGKNDPLKAVNIQLQAAKVEEQQLTFPVGSRSLLTPEHLLERKMEMYPDNLYLPPALP